MSKAGDKIFLSYARVDREPAQKLADHLREAGFRVWDPDYEILPGSDWMSALKKALATSKALVVLISPNAMESRSVSREIEYAFRRRAPSPKVNPGIPPSDEGRALDS